MEAPVPLKLIHQFTITGLGEQNNRAYVVRSRKGWDELGMSPELAKGSLSAEEMLKKIDFSKESLLIVVWLITRGTFEVRPEGNSGGAERFRVVYGGDVSTPGVAEVYVRLPRAKVFALAKGDLAGTVVLRADGSDQPVPVEYKD